MKSKSTVLIWSLSFLLLYGCGFVYARWRKHIVMAEFIDKEHSRILRCCSPGWDVRMNWKGNLKNRVNPWIFRLYSPLCLLENRYRGFDEALPVYFDDRVYLKRILNLHPRTYPENTFRMVEVGDEVWIYWPEDETILRAERIRDVDHDALPDHIWYAHEYTQRGIQLLEDVQETSEQLSELGAWISLETWEEMKAQCLAVEAYFVIRKSPDATSYIWNL